VSDLADIYSEHYFASADPSVLGYDDYSGHAAGLKQVFTEHLDVIERLIAPPAAILDIGCAYGYFLELAARRDWKAQGVEVSAHAANIARREAGVAVHTGTLQGAKFPASVFDAATMWDVLEHAFNPLEELAEVNRVLRPNGYLFLTLPDAGSVIARLSGRHWFGFKKVAEHNYFFSRQTLRRALSQSGFEMITVRGGVWPCSMWFLTTKLRPYSKTAACLAQRLVQALRLEKAVVKFRFIDMFVIAKKTGPPEDNAGQG